MSDQDRRRSETADLLHGPLLGPIVFFAVPLAVSSMLQQLFNAADTAVVGRFAGSQAMAAVGSNSPIINLIVSLFVGCSVGANVVISTLIGQGRKNEISEAVHTAITFALASGIFLIAVGLLAAVPLLRLVDTPEDVQDYAALYLRIFFCGMPFLMLYNFGSAVLRSKGESKKPVYALICGGVLNVCLNLIFVIVFHLHVIGVALATVISNGVSSCLVLRCLVRETGPFHVDPRRLHVKREHLVRMIQIGFPAGLQGIVFSLSNTVVQSGINSFGSLASAGSAAALNFEIIAYYAVNAFNQAAVTFTSQNYAAGKYDRCRKIYRICMLCALASTGCIDFGVILGRNVLLRIFTTDPQVIAYATIRLTHILAFQWMVCSYEVTGSTMRGMGYSMTPAMLTILGTCVLRIFWVLVIFPMYRSLEVLYSVYPVSWVVTGSLVLGAYFVIRRKVFRPEGAI